MSRLTSNGRTTRTKRNPRKMTNYSRLAILLSLAEFSLGSNDASYAHHNQILNRQANAWNLPPPPPHQQQQYYNLPPRGGDDGGGMSTIITQTTTTTGSSTLVNHGHSSYEQEASSYVDADASYYHHPSHREDQVLFKPPKIDLERMSLALRITGEWNRRLVDGVSCRLTTVWNESPSSSSPHHQLLQQQQQQQLRGGSHPVNVHPSRSWHQPITVDDHDTEQFKTKLSVFHANSPREQTRKSKQQRRGAARWGPDLLPYLEQVVDLLGITADDNSDNDDEGTTNVSDGAVEVVLAMIYLDRACSVETPRSHGIPPCPFCTPRTVHRLSLIALIIATQTVRGGTFEEYYDKVQSLGIPASQLQQMVHWMTNALGEAGLLITVEQMMDWSQTWEAIFSPHNAETS